MGEEWTEKDVCQIMTNPAYCLEKIHPFYTESREPFISENDWIEANVKAIETEGAETVLRGIIDNLKNPTTFGYSFKKLDDEIKNEIYDEYKEYCSHLEITPLNFETIEYHIDDIWERTPEAEQRAKFLFAERFIMGGEDPDFKFPVLFRVLHKAKNHLILLSISYLKEGYLLNPLLVEIMADIKYPAI